MFLTMTDTITFHNTASPPESPCSICPVVVALVAGYFLTYCVLLTLLRVNEQRNILHEIRKRKANCLLKQVIEGKIKGEMEVARRRKPLLDDHKDRRGYSHLKEEALDRTMWRHRFGGGFGPVVRQNTE